MSSQTAQSVIDFLLEQGYPVVQATQEEAHTFACYLNIPEGFGDARSEQMQQRAALVEKIERLEVPFVRFGCWPDEGRAALAISGDIDSVTIQDFFLRILEVSR